MTTASVIWSPPLGTVGKGVHLADSHADNGIFVQIPLARVTETNNYLPALRDKLSLTKFLSLRFLT